MTIDNQPVLAVALKAAQLAGEAIIRARADNMLDINRKGTRDLVTSADIEAEKIIIATIQAAFPDHAFLTEEAHPNGNNSHLFDGPLWIVDPIDGTINYAHGLAHVGISIAFALAGTVQVGVVHAPFYDETYCAVKGQGAQVNGKPLSVSQTAEPEQALAATGSPADQSKTQALFQRDQALLSACRSVRRFGSASVDMCWLASDKVDIFLADISPWDIAAGGLIIREAGGQTGQVKPSQLHLPSDLRSENYLAANETLFNRLKTMLV